MQHMRNTLCTAALFSNTTTIYLRYSIYMYRVHKIFTKYIYFFLFTAYCMVFAALYIDIRMSLCKNLQLFKPFVQFVFILLAILCGLSRVSDYNSVMLTCRRMRMHIQFKLTLIRMNLNKARCNYWYFQYCD